MSRPAFFVGPGDLHPKLACLPASPAEGTVVLVESAAWEGALPFHRQRLVLVLSALRHYARELAQAGYTVEVVQAPTFLEGLRQHVRRHGSSRLVALQPREWGPYQALERAAREGSLGVPVELREDGGPGGHFLLTRREFLEWARGREHLRMDLFYQWMRKRTGALMEGGKPAGGRWSFDVDNREPAKGVRPPPVPRYPPDELTRQAMREVAARPGLWGEVEGFDWPVTRAQALGELEHFLAQRARGFGTYEDAMVAGQRWLWHSRLSPAMNLGLLPPGELLERVLAAYARGGLPLNDAEGFVRQVIGWREFIRGVYWLRMPGLRQANMLGATRPLPAFYWQPERTRMRCMQECAGSVYETGYTHHIQRLMVLGNFALLAGVAPLELSHWFWAGFVDAWEWVELPNVHGMALFADGTFTTKPYAASGAYIHKMSNYCQGCAYDVKKRTGEGACPFNPLFWHFLERHRERLEPNPRLATLYRTWDRWSDKERSDIRATAERILAALPGRGPAEHWRFEDEAG